MIGKVMLSGFAGMLMVASSLSVAASPGGLGGKIEQARLLDTLQLDGELFHVQGLELTGSRVWVTSVDGARSRGYLHEFDRKTGKLLRRVDLTDGARYHPGGISIADGTIWVPMAELRPDSTAVLVQIDAQTLQVRRRISVPDHLGCVAVSNGHLVAGNWDSKLLYIIDLAGLAPMRTVPNPTQTRYQDIKFVDGHLVASGSQGWWSGTVDWIEWPTMKLVRSLKAGTVGTIRPFGRGGPLTSEGMAIEGRELYVVPEDGPSRLFHFRLNS